MHKRLTPVICFGVLLLYILKLVNNSSRISTVTLHVGQGHRERLRRSSALAIIKAGPDILRIRTLKQNNMTNTTHSTHFLTKETKWIYNITTAFHFIGCELKPLDPEMRNYWGVELLNNPQKIMKDMYDYCVLRFQDDSNVKAKRICGQTKPNICILQNTFPVPHTLRPPAAVLVPPVDRLSANEHKRKEKQTIKQTIGESKEIPADHSFVLALRITFHKFGCMFYEILPDTLLGYWTSGITEKAILADMHVYCIWAQDDSKVNQRKLCGLKPTKCVKLGYLVSEKKALMTTPYAIEENAIPFFDQSMVESLGMAQITSVKAEPKNVVFRGRPKSPGIQNYFAFVEDFLNKSVIHMYYRCDPPHGEMGADGNDGSICYGRSEDWGLTFTLPQINIHKKNNMLDIDKEGHAFYVFIDEKPGIPESERYKAIGVFEERDSSGGWLPFVSEDGVHFNKIANTTLFIRRQFLNKNKGKFLYAFDSLNQIRWDPSIKKYVANARVVSDWEHRTVMVQTSDDWLLWDDAQWVEAIISPPYMHGEGIYVLNAHRCPAKECSQMYIATATRFNGRTYDQSCFKFVGEGNGANCEDGATDVALFFSHNDPVNIYGPRVWVRPDSKPVADFGHHHSIAAKSDDGRAHWAPRNTFGTSGLFDRKKYDEIWFYVLHDATWPSAYVQRYSLGRFRFGSISCKITNKVCLVTLRPFWVNSKTDEDMFLNLRVNSIFGFVNANLQYVSKDRVPIPNDEFSFSSATTFVGDEIQHPLRWGEDRWRLRLTHSVIKHEGPNNDMYKNFEAKASRPYNMYSNATGRGLKEFIRHAARHPDVLRRTRTIDNVQAEEICVLVRLEMSDADVYAIGLAKTRPKSEKQHF